MIPCEICNKEPGNDELHEFRCPVCGTILLLCDSCYEKTIKRLPGMKEGLVEFAFKDGFEEGYDTRKCEE